MFDIDGWEVKKRYTCEKGSQLRPHIVWFGEAVPMMDVALDITDQADILIVVGTSLNVYPAAGLVYAVRAGIPIYVVDPNTPAMHQKANVTFIAEPATIGLTRLAEQLLSGQAQGVSD